MKVAVTASSGQLGAAITRAAVARVGAENVVAVARTPSKVTVLDVEVRAGDYNDREQLTAAFAGVDVVLLVSSNASPADRLAQHTHVVEAAKSAGASKVVFTSIIGSLEGNSFNAVVKSNRDTEDMLKNAGIAWSIGRNSIYIEPDFEYIDTYIKDGKITNSAGDGKCAYTCRSELAEAYTTMMLDDAHNGQIYNLAGAGITQTELAEIFNEVWGTSLTYEPLSVEAYEADRIAELGEHLGIIISGIYAGIRAGVNDVSSDFHKILGRPHMSMLEFARVFKSQTE